MTSIPFNKPFIAGKELYYIARAVSLGNISGDGHFTQQCAELLERQFNIQKILLTPSCTAALEMAAILCDLGPGDEVLLPSYTFVSTASAVCRVGAKPVFVDIRPDTLNIDERQIAEAITPQTKAIFPVHYAGVGCAMEPIMELAAAHKLTVVEDAAQGVNAHYRGRALGSIGHMGTFSFHETKNYICGEGGALAINDPQFIERAEILRDKGTNRRQFFRGEVDKYTWVDIGSSYVPSEIVCAFLYGQLECMNTIAERRRSIYARYSHEFESLERAGNLQRPTIPGDCESNFHMFYVLLENTETRDALIEHLRQAGVMAVFHYVPLHLSPVGRRYGYAPGDLPVTEDLSSRLLRLPFYYEITREQQTTVIEAIRQFFAASQARKAA